MTRGCNGDHIVRMQVSAAGIGCFLRINVMACTIFFLVGVIVSIQAFLLQIAAFATRHGEHTAEAGEVRAADHHAGGRTIYRNLNHGVVNILVAVAHLIF